jgi:hypothetical protein
MGRDMAHHDDRSYDGLGNHIYLEKQDKLRDIGIDIQTSQVYLTLPLFTPPLLTNF